MLTAINGEYARGVPCSRGDEQASSEASRHIEGDACQHALRGEANEAMYATSRINRDDARGLAEL